MSGRQISNLICDDLYNWNSSETIHSILSCQRVYILLRRACCIYFLSVHYEFHAWTSFTNKIWSYKTKLCFVLWSLFSEIVSNKRSCSLSRLKKYAETKCDSARYKIFPLIEFFALCTFRNSCFFNYFGGRLSMGTKDNYIFVDFYKRCF